MNRYWMCVNPYCTKKHYWVISNNHPLCLYCGSVLEEQLENTQQFLKDVGQENNSFLESIVNGIRFVFGSHEPIVIYNDPNEDCAGITENEHDEEYYKSFDNGW